MELGSITNFDDERQPSIDTRCSLEEQMSPIFDKTAERRALKKKEKASTLMALMAITTAGLSLFAVRAGAWASFVTDTVSHGRVNTGTVAVKAVACQQADSDARFVKGGADEGTFNICQGGPWQPFHSTNAVTSASLSSGAGFSSTSAVTVDDLSDSPSDLPSAIPVLVTNQGSLPVAGLRLSLTIDAATKTDSSLRATVLYGGRVVAPAQPLSALAASRTELLSTPHLLEPGASGLVQIDLVSAAHAPKLTGSDKTFDITVTLSGSDA
jgi:hypothetical protein